MFSGMVPISNLRFKGGPKSHVDRNLSQRGAPGGRPRAFPGIRTRRLSRNQPRHCAGHGNHQPCRTAGSTCHGRRPRRRQPLKQSRHARPARTCNTSVKALLVRAGPLFQWSSPRRGVSASALPRQSWLPLRQSRGAPRCISLRSLRLPSRASGRDQAAARRGAHQFPPA